MTSVLQIGVLRYFSLIFPALLVFVIVFALLEKTKVIGENKVVNSIIAIAIGFMVILFQDIVSIINYMAPWFVLLFVFFVLLLMLYKLLGASDQNISDFFMKNKGVQALIFGIGLVILIASIAHVYGQRLLPATEGGIDVTTISEAGTFKENVLATLFNPQILGVIFILIVAVAAIVLLTKEKL